jgi:outer membrane protein assembly factor BamA
LSATYTTKQQLLVNAKNTLLLDDNKIFLSGDLRYYIFSQDNYGLGTDIIPQNEDEFNLDALTEPMKYNYFKFHQTISWKVSTDFYMGMGLHLDGYSNIIDEQLNIANDQLTAHYNYSKKYEFNDKEYYVNGLSLNLVYDSRDNQINANKGWFANLNYRVNPSFNKNQAASSVLYTEYRYFKSLSSTNTQHVLSLWAFGQFLISGKLPYLNLPIIGGDQRSRSGKGYTQGLFRGFNLVNVETEYRFPISCNQLFSGTIFANFTSTTDKDRNISLFQYIQPAAGIGFRILLDKATRTNLVLNYGWGRKSKGFYLNAGETF